MTRERNNNNKHNHNAKKKNKVGEDKVITFLPSKDVEGIKKVNSGANALAEVYLDSETGLIKDASKGKGLGNIFLKHLCLNVFNI